MASLLQFQHLNIEKVTLGGLLLSLCVSTSSSAIDDYCPVIIASSERNSHWVAFKHELLKAFDGDLKEFIPFINILVLLLLELHGAEVSGLDGSFQ